MSIGFWRDSSCISVRCMVLALVTVNFSSGVTPSSSRPRLRMVSIFSGQKSIRVTSWPAWARLPPTYPPSARTPTTAILLPMILYSLGCRQLGEERLDCLIEKRGLMQVGGMARVGNDRLGRALDLGRHVVGGGEEVGVVGTDQHQGRHGNRVERLDHAVVLLGQHAARRAGEALGVAMAGELHLVARIQ